MVFFFDDGLPADTVSRLLQFYDQDADLGRRDCEAGLDSGIHDILVRGGDLSGARSELAGLLARSDNDDDLQLVMDVVAPGGRSTRAFLEYVLRRLDTVMGSPESISQDRGWFSGSGMCHHSRFVDEAAAKTAATDVLLAGESRVHAWTLEAQQASRLHLVADLDRPVGFYKPIDDLTPVRDEVATSTCAVVMQKVLEGRPRIIGCYPDAPISLSIREQYPDVVSLFGGYFYQYPFATGGWYWRAEEDFHHENSAEVVGRVATQLGDLLASIAPGSDEELRGAVHDLGTCVGPADMRRWVSGLHRRMTDLEW